MRSQRPRWGWCQVGCDSYSIEAKTVGFKLQPRLLRLAMSFRGKGLTQRTVVMDTKTRVKLIAAMCDPGCGKGYDNKNA